jgi:hypothetical protein
MSDRGRGLIAGLEATAGTGPDGGNGTYQAFTEVPSIQQTTAPESGQNRQPAGLPVTGAQAQRTPAASVSYLWTYAGDQVLMQNAWGRLEEAPISVGPLADITIDDTGPAVTLTTAAGDFSPITAGAIVMISGLTGGNISANRRPQIVIAATTTVLTLANSGAALVAQGPGDSLTFWNSGQQLLGNDYCPISLQYGAAAEQQRAYGAVTSQWSLTADGTGNSRALAVAQELMPISASFGADIFTGTVTTPPLTDAFRFGPYDQSETGFGMADFLFAGAPRTATGDGLLAQSFGLTISRPQAASWAGNNSTLEPVTTTSGDIAPLEVSLAFLAAPAGVTLITGLNATGDPVDVGFSFTDGNNMIFIYIPAMTPTGEEMPIFSTGAAGVQNANGIAVLDPNLGYPATWARFTNYAII